MKKSDLKPGMIVKYRNGNWRMVIPTFDRGLLLMGTRGFCSLSDFNEDLTYSRRESIMDIIEVRANTFIWTFNDLIDCFANECKLLWKREEKTTFTMQEIADKFNIPVESLRIKE